MSENDPITAAITAAVAEADPTSDAARAVGGDDSSADDGDGGETPDPSADGDGDGEIPAAEKPAKAEETPADDGESEVEDEFADEHGIRSKEPSGRENRIPYSRVKKITENAVKKAASAWEGERAQLTEHNTVYVTRLKGIAQTEDIMLQEPERFVQMLAKLPGVGDRYKQLLGGGGKPAADVPDEANDPMPEADGQMPDGSPGYTPAQHKKLLEWNRRQGVREAEARLAERYAPIENAFKQSQEMQRRQQGESQAINAEIAEAAKWRFFKEHEDDILAAMTEDTRANGKTGKFKYRNLREVYEDVVFGRLSASRQKQREEILKELGQAPGSTSVARSTKPRDTGDDPNDDPVTQAMKRELRKHGMLGK